MEDLFENSYSVLTFFFSTLSSIGYPSGGSLAASSHLVFYILLGGEVKIHMISSTYMIQASHLFVRIYRPELMGL